MRDTSDIFSASVFRVNITSARLVGALGIVGALNLLGGCKARDSFSDLRVVNGRTVTAGEYNAVVQIGVSLGGGSMAACTSTWVSDRVILTAAHCVEEAAASPGRVSVVDGVGKGLKASKVYMHPTYRPNNGNGHDIAILLFPEGSSPVFMPMALKQPSSGDRLVIVGYGKFDHRNGMSGGTKRTGTNKVRGIGWGGRIEFDGLIRPLNSEGTGADVTNSQGDSGGPMIIDGRVVGVSSSVNSNPTAEGKLRGNYENVRHPAIADWLNKLAQQGVYMIGFSAGTESMQGTAGGNSLSPQGNQDADDNPVRIPDQVPDAPSDEFSNMGQNSDFSQSGRLLNCNEDSEEIRNGGGSGICRNTSSGFCYRYGGGQVQYDAGRLECPQ